MQKNMVKRPLLGTYSIPHRVLSPYGIFASELVNMKDFSAIGQKCQTVTALAHDQNTSDVNNR